MEHVFSLIKLSLLPALGISEGYFYFCLIMLGLICSYLIVQPFVEWFILLNSKRLLSYIVTSLFVLSIFFTFSSSINESAVNVSMIFQILLKGLAIFGVILILHALFQKVSNKNHNKKKA